MHTNLTVKLIISSLLLVLLFIAGVILHRSGKPYPALLFNVHKLSAVAIMALLFVSALKQLRQDDPGWILYLTLGVMALAALGLLISGGMLSLDKLHASMNIIHRWTTGLFLVSYVLFIYLAMSGAYLNIQN